MSNGTKTRTAEEQAKIDARMAKARAAKEEKARLRAEAKAARAAASAQIVNDFKEAEAKRMEIAKKERENAMSGNPQGYHIGLAGLRPGMMYLEEGFDGPLLELKAIAEALSQINWQDDLEPKEQDRVGAWAVAWKLIGMNLQTLNPEIDVEISDKLHSYVDHYGPVLGRLVEDMEIQDLSEDSLVAFYTKESFLKQSDKRAENHDFDNPDFWDDNASLFLPSERSVAHLISTPKPFDEAASEFIGRNIISETYSEVKDVNGWSKGYMDEDGVLLFESETLTELAFEMAEYRKSTDFGIPEMYIGAYHYAKYMGWDQEFLDDIKKQYVETMEDPEVRAYQYIKGKTAHAMFAQSYLKGNYPKYSSKAMFVSFVKHLIRNSENKLKQAKLKLKVYKKTHKFGGLETRAKLTSAVNRRRRVNEALSQLLNVTETQEENQGPADSGQVLKVDDREYEKEIDGTLRFK